MTKIFGTKKVIIGTLIVTIAVLVYAIAKNFYFPLINEYSEYIKHKDSIVEIQAEVSKIDKQVGSNGNSGYKIYIAYNYNGEHYGDIYHDTTGDEKKYSIGDKIPLEISSVDPGYVNTTTSDDYHIPMLAIGSMVLSILMTTLIDKMNFYRRNYIINEKRIARDLKYKNIYDASIPFMCVFVTFASSKLLLPEIKLWDYVLPISLAISAALLGYYTARTTALSEKSYEIKKSKCLGLRVERVSDSSSNHYITFEGIGEMKRPNIIRDEIKKNEEYYLLFRGKKAIAVYDAKKWSVNIDDTRFGACIKNVIYMTYIKVAAFAVFTLLLIAMVRIIGEYGLK